MATDLDGRKIKGVAMGNQAFINAWKKLPPNVKAEAETVITNLLFKELDAVPRKLHMHQLVGLEVPSVLEKGKKVRPWTIHITADDKYKASFTLEQGVMHFRVCGLHDSIDKNP